MKTWEIPLTSYVPLSGSQSGIARSAFEINPTVSAQRIGQVVIEVGGKSGTNPGASLGAKLGSQKPWEILPSVPAADLKDGSQWSIPLRDPLDRMQVLAQTYASKLPPNAAGIGMGPIRPAKQYEILPSSQSARPTTNTSEWGCHGKCEPCASQGTTTGRIAQGPQKGPCAPDKLGAQGSSGRSPLEGAIDVPRGLWEPLPPHDTGRTTRTPNSRGLPNRALSDFNKQFFPSSNLQVSTESNPAQLGSFGSPDWMALSEQGRLNAFLATKVAIADAQQIEDSFPKQQDSTRDGGKIDSIGAAVESVRKSMDSDKFGLIDPWTDASNLQSKDDQSIGYSGPGASLPTFTTIDSLSYFEPDWVWLPRIRPGSFDSLIPTGRPAADYQAETSVVVIPPGSSAICPYGAVIVGYNSRGSRTSGADPYLRIGGVAVQRDPLSFISSWVTSPQETLADIARASLPDVRQLMGDPFLVRAHNARVLYSQLASSSNDRPGTSSAFIPPDRIVVHRSDDCGATWAVSSVPLSVPGPGFDVNLIVDRPMMTVDQTNPQHVYLAFDASGGLDPTGNFVNSSGQYIVESADNGVAWSSPVALPARPGGLPQSPVLSPRPGGGLIAAWAEQLPTSDATILMHAYRASSSPTPLVRTSWSSPFTLVDTTRFKEHLGTPRGPRNDWQPQVATAADDSVCVVVPKLEPSTGKCNLLVFRSIDAIEWSLVTEIDDPEADLALPKLVAGQRFGMRVPLVLAWYATEPHKSTRFNVQAAASMNGGATWGRRVTITHTDSFVPILDGDDLYFGDYFGGAWIPSPSASMGQKFIFVWMDSRDGRTTRLYSSSVEVVA